MFFTLRTLKVEEIPKNNAQTKMNHPVKFGARTWKQLVVFGGDGHNLDKWGKKYIEQESQKPPVPWGQGGSPTTPLRAEWGLWSI